MILLTRNQASHPTTVASGPILIFGLGLIGSECLSRLIEQGYEVKFRANTAWGNISRILENFQSLFEYLKEHETQVIRTLWAAGKAGFEVNETAAAQELSEFQTIIQEIQNLCNRLAAQHRLYLISSAGGLFEGQLLVDQDSIPRPARPYGQLKLDQEIFSKSVGAQHVCVLRPTSVYGRISVHKRMGLIPRLVYNAMTSKLSVIVGRSDTLRDYISVQDVARAAVHCLESIPDSASRTEIICSGKPSSIFEIQHHIEELVRSKLYLVFLNQSNAQSMTFRPCDLAKVFLGGGLRERISEIYREWHYQR